MTAGRNPEAPTAATTYVICACALRDLGDGFIAILLLVYLLALGHSAVEVGIIGE